MPKSLEVLRKSVAHHTACELTLVFVKRALAEHSLTARKALASDWATDMAKRLPTLKANLKDVTGASPRIDVEQWDRGVAMIQADLGNTDRAIAHMGYFHPGESKFFLPFQEKLKAELAQLEAMEEQAARLEKMRADGWRNW
jgi:hypothetical protein